MRRIYDSSALRRDDDDPFSPTSESKDRPSAMRSMNSLALSQRVVPERLRRYGVSVSIATPRTEYSPDESVPFLVTMRNTLPFPVALSTTSQVRWTWSIDGHDEAAQFDLEYAADPGQFEFNRGERKRFPKRWQQVFRVSETEWERAPPGTYTIGARINVDGAEAAGLAAETTIKITEE
ncbi:hypothetical protein G6M89_12160 [Natronolimnobius sp. AArcel1]|uniref:hypothetical protein n=1 Tax=Natronolimnobius sp. AArcel1 TaxID=1679093 RepID=UPI0013EC8DE0|nr:hypothetical protein [Natronolimnobius sp. AArcel1]NGM69753.1 hypothetical protein [Natronolimnobius sp. AArcel1]